MKRLISVTSFGGASENPLNTSHGGQSNMGTRGAAAPFTIDTKTIPLLSHQTSVHSNNPVMRMEQSVTNTDNAEFVITQNVIESLGNETSSLQQKKSASSY